MKKIISIALILVMTMALFGACGGGTTSDSTTKTNETSTPAERTESASGETTEIAVSLWDYSNLDYYKIQFSAFEEAFPQYTIKVLESPSNEYDDKIQIMLSGGDDVDVVFTKGTPAMSGLVQKNQLLPLNEFIDSSKLDPASYSGLVSHLEQDGKIYGIPYRKDNNFIYYNKDLFDAAGVDYPTDGMTMDEYRELAKKMTSGEGADKIYGAHSHTWAGNVYQYARRIEAYDPINKPVDVLIPYYETILAMQNEDKSIMDYASLKAGNIHYSGVFYNQQAAMLQMGSWFTNMLVENTASGDVTFSWGVCSLPNIDGIGNTAGVGGVTPVSINSKAKNPQGAWELIEFITGLEGALILAESGILPGYTNDEVVEKIVNIPGVPENMTEYLNLDKIVVEQEMHPNAREIDKVISEQHDLIMVSGATIEDGLAEMQERIDEVLQG